ncbi:MAG: hypothetical protein NVSMB9_11140 [Isosphaeraceae bacterium]
MSIALSNRTSMRSVLPWAVLALGLVLVALNLLWMFRGRSLPAATTANGPREEARPAGGLPGTVSLAEGKLKAVGIKVENVGLTSLPTELGVPGRIDSNQDRQVQVRPRATGVIREVKIALGQNVKKGQTLVVLDSPEIGSARLNLRAKQRELANVRTEAAWKNQVAENVASLIPELRKATDAVIIQKEYANRPLGTFRATLLQAYAEFDIAAHEEEKTGALRKQRIIGEHPAFVAKHTRESAQAKFEGVIEQAKFDANYQNLLVSQQVRLAESSVIDAAQRLRILGVSENIDDLLAHADRAADARKADEDVTAYTIEAPFDGTIISKSTLAVPSQKAELTEVLFTLADLSNVWVLANIPESDFSLLPALQKGTIRLTATAYPDRAFKARVLSVGATVDPSTRTVPMLAETDNPDGLLKIGMFVRIVLDTTTEDRVLTVPSSALVEIEGKAGVFVPEGKDGRSFAFHAVRLGRESAGRQVITSGLAPGAVVVSRGAYELKAELILQNETGED